MTVPTVIKDECTGCEECVETCPEGAIAMVDDIAVIDPAKCNECGDCIEACPADAIVEEE